MSLTPRLENSGCSLANAPSSVVHTGVKSAGCEKRTTQLLPMNLLGWVTDVNYNPWDGEQEGLLVEVDLAVGSLGSEVRSFSAEAKTGLLTDLVEAGKATDGGRDFVGAELERGPDDWVSEEESRGERAKGGNEGTHSD